MTFTNEQNDSLQLSLRITSTLSIIGTIAIISSYIMVAKHRTQMNQLVVFMSMADFFSSISIFLGNWPLVGSLKSEAFCTIQAFNIQLWFPAASLWTCCMATHCALCVISQKPIISLSGNFRYYHIVSWGLPLVFACVPFLLQAVTPSLGNAYSSAVVWCWISKNYSIWRIYLFYGPIWIMFLYNLGCYAFVGYKIRQLSKEIGSKSKHSIRTRRHASRFVIKTAVYMAAFFINWVSSTTNRVQNLVDPANPIFILALLQTSTIALQGFMNAIIYFTFAYIDNVADRNVNKEQPRAIFHSSTTNVAAEPKADYKEEWA